MTDVANLAGDSPPLHMEIFIVEVILGHSFSALDGHCEMLVRWIGYCEQFDTWEPVSNFTDLGIVESYLKHNSISPSGILPSGYIPSHQHILGDVAGQEISLVGGRDFSSVHVIVDEIYRLRGHHTFSSHVRVLHTWKDFPVEPTILLHGYGPHLFVVYYRPGRCHYVCDGANVCLDDEIFATLRSCFDGDMRALSYEKPPEPSLHSSPEVMIALRFLELARRSSLLDSLLVITTPAHFLDRVAIESSISDSGSGGVSPAYDPSFLVDSYGSSRLGVGDLARVERRCFNCKKSFFKKTLQALRCHERSCK